MEEQPAFTPATETTSGVTATEEQKEKTSQRKMEQPQRVVSENPFPKRPFHEDITPGSSQGPSPSTDQGRVTQSDDVIVWTPLQPDA